MKIFLSSTYMDLIEYRSAAANALERLGQQGIRMEVFGARPEDATTASLDEIQESDALVGIYAHRYGYVPAGQLVSITEQEYDFARVQGKPVFCFLIDDEQPWIPKFIDGEPQRTAMTNFKQRVRSQVITETITAPQDLAFKLAASLGRFLLARKVKEKLESVPNSQTLTSASGRSQVARRAVRLQKVVSGATVLLVNDAPEEMAYVIELLKDLEIEVVVATDSALALLHAGGRRYDAIISDMARNGVTDEGIRLLKELRESGSTVPVIFTVGQYNPQLGTPPFAFGITNRIDECLNLLFDALERVRG